MSRQEAYEDFFYNAADKFIEIINKEIGTVALFENFKKQGIKPRFHFEWQISHFCGIPALSTDEKINFKFDPEKYKEKLEALYFYFNFIAPRENLIDLVRIIRELMIIADVNLPLFLSTGTLSYSAVAQKIKDFIAEWEQNAQSIVAKLRKTFEHVNFQKMKEDLLSKITSELISYDQGNPHKISLKLAEYLKQLKIKVEVLHLQDDVSRFQLMGLVCDYITRGNPKEIISDLFILDGKKNDTRERKSYVSDVFKAIYAGESIPEKPVFKTPEEITAQNEASKIQREQHIATKAKHKQEQEWLEKCPFDFSVLKKEIELNIDEWNKSFIEQLKNPDLTDERCAEIHTLLETYRKIKTALSCLIDPGKYEDAKKIKNGGAFEIKYQDALNIAQLALHYIEMSGSKIIFIESSKMEFRFASSVSNEDIQAYYHKQFLESGIPKYDKTIAEALLQPPMQTSSALKIGMFSHGRPPLHRTHTGLPPASEELSNTFNPICSATENRT